MKTLKAITMSMGERDNGLILRGLIHEPLLGLKLQVEIRHHDEFNTYGVYVLRPDPLSTQWVIVEYKSLPNGCTVGDVRSSLKSIFKNIGI